MNNYMTSGILVGQLGAPVGATSGTNSVRLLEGGTSRGSKSSQKFWRVRFSIFRV